MLGNPGVPVEAGEANFLGGDSLGSARAGAAGNRPAAEADLATVLKDQVLVVGAATASSNPDRLLKRLGELLEKR